MRETFMIIKNILIADENEYIRKAIIERFENSYDSTHHFVIFEAKDGEEALNIMGVNNIHIAIIDVNLPKVNGFEVLRTIKQSFVKAHVPVILLSNNIHRATRTKAYELGAVGVVPKPFSTLEVYNMVRSILRTQDEYLHVNEVVHLISFIEEITKKDVNIVYHLLDEFLSEYFTSYHMLALSRTSQKVLYNRGFENQEVEKILNYITKDDHTVLAGYSVIKFKYKGEEHYIIFKIFNDNKRFVVLKKLLNFWSELNDK